MDRCRWSAHVGRASRGVAAHCLLIVIAMVAASAASAQTVTYTMQTGNFNSLFTERNNNPPYAGTYNNNVLTMAAGVAGIGEVYTPQAAKELNDRGDSIRERLNAICRKHQVAFQFSGIGSMMTAHATSRPIRTAADIAGGSQDAKELFYFDMMAAGIWIARRGFVALNIMIGEAEGDRFVAAVEEFVTARKALLKA